MKTPRMLCLALAAATLCGCMIQNNKDKLSTSLKKYNAALRWGAMDRAAEHVAPGNRRALLNRREFGELKVSQCEIGSVRLHGKGLAIATVRIDWYMVRNPRLRTSFVEQQWRLDDGRWRIASQRLVGGAPCPLFAPEASPEFKRQMWPVVSQSQ